jgi:hypothetical protein
MNTKYTLNEGYESLERIKLMMNYDLFKTFDENHNLFEQLIGTSSPAFTGNAGLSQKREEEKSKFLENTITVKTPYVKTQENDEIQLPKNTKTVLWGPSDSRTNYFFKNWYKSQYEEYIPKEDYLKKILPDNTLRYFTLPNGEVFSLRLKTYDDKTWTPLGYYNKDNKQYTIKEYIGKIPELLQPNWFEKNSLLLSQIAVSLVVGFLTGGESLIFQAMAQLGVDVSYAGIYLSKGDKVGAAICLLMGLVPVGGRLAQYGVKENIQFLSKYGKTLAEIPDNEGVIKFFNALNESDKLLMTRVFKQTPGELKNIATKTLVEGFEKGVKSGSIVLKDIPLAQRLQWKQFFVEGGLSLSVGVGAQLTYSIYEAKKEMESLQTRLNNTEKRNERSKVYEKKSETQKDSSYLRVSNKINYDEDF